MLPQLKVQLEKHQKIFESTSLNSSHGVGCPFRFDTNICYWRALLPRSIRTTRRISTIAFLWRRLVCPQKQQNAQENRVAESSSAKKTYRNNSSATAAQRRLSSYSLSRPKVASMKTKRTNSCNMERQFRLLLAQGLYVEMPSSYWPTEKIVGGSQGT